MDLFGLATFETCPFGFWLLLLYICRQISLESDFFFGEIGNKWIEDFFYQMLICGFQNRVFKTLYFRTPYLNGLLIFSVF